MDKPQVLYEEYKAEEIDTQDDQARPDTAVGSAAQARSTSADVQVAHMHARRAERAAVVARTMGPETQEAQNRRKAQELIASMAAADIASIERTHRRFSTVTILSATLAPARTVSRNGRTGRTRRASRSVRRTARRATARGSGRRQADPELAEPRGLARRGRRWVR